MSDSLKAKSCGIIPFSREGDQLKFLIIKHQAGHWSFSKGTQEPGETDLETAKREFMEETGIKDVVILPDDNFIEKYSITKDGVEIDKEVVYFLGEVSAANVNIQLKEISDHAWLDYEGVVDKLTYPETARIFKEAFKKLTEHAG